MNHNVTVITPTLGKRPQWLSLVIQDIKNQTVKPAEHIIRVNVNNENSYVSLNNAIALARTEWVAICCDDDRFYPNHLETMLKEASEADLVYSGSKHIGLKTGTFVETHNPRNIKLYNYITNPMINKGLWEHFGGYGTKTVDEDHKLYKKISQFFTIKGTGKVTWEYRFHADQDSKNFGGNVGS